MSEPIDLGSDETEIWRYMDLSRFVAMLASSSLWFAKAAHFEDGYEGFCNIIPRKMPAVDPHSKCITRTSADGETMLVSLTEAMVELSDHAADYLRHAREHLFVNSWCMARESMAMWEIYANRGCGVAVKSSVGKYIRAAKFNVRQEQYGFKQVSYDVDPRSNPDLTIDLRTGSIPAPGLGVWEIILKLAFHKRTCFIHEQEWRAALFQDRREDAGCNIDFEIKELISKVYVGPRSDKFFFDVVGSVMEGFGLKTELEKSTLLVPPVH